MYYRYGTGVTTPADPSRDGTFLNNLTQQLYIYIYIYFSNSLSFSSLTTMVRLKVILISFI